MSDSFVNNKESLEERVNLFNQMALPGQPLGMHMGTSYLVNDLMREIQELREALKPFAEIAKELSPQLPDDEKNTFAWAVPYAGAFRIARAKLEGSGA